MNEVTTNPNEAWRYFTTQSPIAACKLRGIDDLKRLYKILNQKQAEHGETFVSRLSRADDETQEQFDTRQIVTKNAFITTIRVTAENGEIVTGHGESFFDSQSMPDRIMSIFYDTSFSPNAILKYMPVDRATVLLDFSKPPLLDFNGQPSAPTPNGSNFFISAANEAWSTSLRSRLNEFFEKRPANASWIHRQGAYDALLLLIGFPAALWGSFRLGGLIPSSIPSGLSIIIYIYLFIVIMNCFRSLFSYARWAFPKVELEDKHSAVARHRAILTVIFLGIFSAAIWDALKFII